MSAVKPDKQKLGYTNSKFDQEVEGHNVPQTENWQKKKDRNPKLEKDTEIFSQRSISKENPDGWIYSQNVYQTSQAVQLRCPKSQNVSPSRSAVSVETEKIFTPFSHRTPLRNKEEIQFSALQRSLSPVSKLSANPNDQEPSDVLKNTLNFKYDDYRTISPNQTSTVKKDTFRDNKDLKNAYLQDRSAENSNYLIKNVEDKLITPALVNNLQKVKISSQLQQMFINSSRAHNQSENKAESTIYTPIDKKTNLMKQEDTSLDDSDILHVNKFNFNEYYGQNSQIYDEDQTKKHLQVFGKFEGNFTKNNEKNSKNIQEQLFLHKINKKQQESNMDALSQSVNSSMYDSLRMNYLNTHRNHAQTSRTHTLEGKNRDIRGSQTQRLASGWLLTKGEPVLKEIRILPYGAFTPIKKSSKDLNHFSIDQNKEFENQFKMAHSQVTPIKQKTFLNQTAHSNVKLSTPIQNNNSDMKVQTDRSQSCFRDYRSNQVIVLSHKKIQDEQNCNAYKHELNTPRVTVLSQASAQKNNLNVIRTPKVETKLITNERIYNKTPIAVQKHNLRPLSQPKPITQQYVSKLVDAPQISQTQRGLFSNRNLTAATAQPLSYRSVHGERNSNSVGQQIPQYYNSSTAYPGIKEMVSEKRQL